MLFSDCLISISAAAVCSFYLAHQLCENKICAMSLMALGHHGNFIAPFWKYFGELGYNWWLSWISMDGRWLRGLWDILAAALPVLQLNVRTSIRCCRWNGVTLCLTCILLYCDKLAKVVSRINHHKYCNLVWSTTVTSLLHWASAFVEPSGQCCKLKTIDVLW